MPPIRPSKKHHKPVVYLPEAHIDYELHHIIGAYSTEEKAKQAAKNYGHDCTITKERVDDEMYEDKK